MAPTDTAPPTQLGDVSGDRTAAGSPWALAALLEAGEPGEIDAMAAGWTGAADTAADATSTGQTGSQTTGDGALLDGAPAHPAAEAAAQTSRQLGLGGEQMRSISTTLTTTATSLRDNTKLAQDEIVALETAIAAATTTANQGIADNAASANAQLATAQSSQQADAIISNARYVERGIIDTATDRINGAIEASRVKIAGYVEAYEGVLSDGMRSLSNLGFSPDQLAETGLDDITPDLPPNVNRDDEVAVANWWNNLSATEQNALIAANPGLIGNLNGVSAEARDAANRLNLEKEQTRLEVRLREIEEGMANSQTLPTESELLEAELIRQDLADINRITDTLNAETASDTNGDGVIDGSDTDNGRRLLVFDTTTGDRTLAAVAIGNVDTAQNVAVHVPGLGTTVENGLIGKTESLQKLVDSARAEGRGTVAGIEWIGYEPPSSFLFVSDRQPAIDGGAALADFAEGIDASRGDSNDPNITAIGHSYGGVTLGYALRESPTPDENSVIDSAITYGPIGFGDDDRPLEIPHSRVYELQGPTDLPGGFGYSAGNHGLNPGLYPGAISISAEDATTPDGRQLRSSDMHSDFEAPDTTAHYNQVQVILGQYDETILDPTNPAGVPGDGTNGDPLPATPEERRQEEIEDLFDFSDIFEPR